MSKRAESIISEALSLSPYERTEVIERLYESLRSDREREIERAWVAESERRIDAHQRAEEPSVSYERMKRELTDR